MAREIRTIDNQEYYSTAKTAKMCGVDQSTIREWCDTGKIKGTRLDKLWYVRADIAVATAEEWKAKKEKALAKKIKKAAKEAKELKVIKVVRGVKISKFAPLKCEISKIEAFDKDILTIRDIMGLFGWSYNQVFKQVNTGNLKSLGKENNQHQISKQDLINFVIGWQNKNPDFIADIHSPVTIGLASNVTPEKWNKIHELAKDAELSVSKFLDTRIITPFLESIENPENPVLFSEEQQDMPNYFIECKSRRMQLLFQPSLYNDLKEWADTEHDSVNNLIVRALTKAVAEHKKATEPSLLEQMAKKEGKTIPEFLLDMINGINNLSPREP